ncbi:MAG: class I SAM-dependent methyltransferase [Flavobacteriales bacterium]|nr:class I SAM-dependent methyltransferase [Flavobacteriales bacterium]
MSAERFPAYHQHCIVCGSDKLRPMKAYMKHQMVRCGNCSMVFMHRIPTEEQLDDHYSQYSYHEDRWISPITIQRYNELLDRFEKYRKTNRLLDVGCGIGEFLSVAKERGWEVYGTEFSSTAVEICQKKGIQMLQGNLSARIFPEEYFDVITSFEVIEHIYHPTHDVKVIYELLRRGGMHYCTTPNFNALHRYKLKAEYDIIYFPEHLAYFTPKTLKRIMTDAGFRVVKTETTGINLTRIARSKDLNSTVLRGEETPNEQMREKTETQWPWRLAKVLANTGLNITGLGAALKISVVKPS